MKLIGSIVLMLGVLLTPAASADKIYSAEQGATRFAFAQFEHVGKTVRVKSGESAWSETVRQSDSARLLDEIPIRARPSKVAGIPEGTLLTGYQLSSGVAYCDAPKAEAVNKKAQCLRDLDGDGTFDAAQVTAWTKVSDVAFGAHVTTIVPMSKARYERLALEVAPPHSATIFYAGLKKSSPLFTISVETNKLEPPISCTPVETSVCEILGVRVRYAVGTDASITLILEGAAENRTFEPYRLADPKAFDRRS